MGKRKSYKRKNEFKTETEMRHHLCEYHEAVLRDLLGSEQPAERWVHELDYHIFQRSHIKVGKGFYILSTHFDADGYVVHELEKIGATNRVVRQKSFIPGVWE